MRTQTTPNIAIILPTIRSLDFLEEWGSEFKDCVGIVVEDHAKQEIPTPSSHFKQTFHYTWQDISQDLKKNEWIIARKNSGIRSYGFLKAWQMGCTHIITLDDDCYPVPNQNFVQEHVQNLSLHAADRWTPSYPHRQHMFTRGFPYGIRGQKPVKLSHGLWKNVLDQDAPTQLLNPHLTISDHFPFLEVIPKDQYFPVCSMNLAFHRDVTPLMYFLLMGSDPTGKPWGLDRFDDIWCGILAKKVMDHLGYAAVNGAPWVEHRKASNVFTNLKKEAAGIELNEDFWQWVDAVQLSATTPAECYIELTQKISFPKTEYFKTLRKAMLIWADLFA